MGVEYGLSGLSGCRVWVGPVGTYECVCDVEKSPGCSRVHEPLEEVEEEAEAPDEDNVERPEPRGRDPCRVGVFSRRRCLVHSRRKTKTCGNTGNTGKALKAIT